MGLQPGRGTGPWKQTVYMITFSCRGEGGRKKRCHGVRVTRVLLVVKRENEGGAFCAVHQSQSVIFNPLVSKRKRSEQVKI